MRERWTEWAKACPWGQRSKVTHDAEAVLACASVDGPAVALISGTGSLAYGRSATGETARAGGLGPTLGDEGSGYAIGLAGLQAAARCHDQRQQDSAEHSMSLLDRALHHFRCMSPDELTSLSSGWTPGQISSFAQAVIEAMGCGDAVARQIVHRAAIDLVQLVRSVLMKLHMEASEGSIPLAMAGGVLVNSDAIRNRITAELESLVIKASPLIVVVDPVAGATKIAAEY